MNAPTAKQLVALRLLGKGMTIREMCAEMGLASTNAVAQHIALLAKKGCVDPAKNTVTPAGWAALGLRDCGQCKGTGKVKLTTKARI